MAEPLLDSGGHTDDARAGRAGPGCCPVVELRRYLIQTSKRDAFIALFEREFVETQEATGIRLIGQFRDVDDPDIFVWIRGFPSMKARAISLSAFYGGPVWEAHRDAANSLLVDNDDVRLLRPANDQSGFTLGPRRAALGGSDGPGGVLVVTIYPVAIHLLDAFPGFFERSIAPVLTEGAATILATFVTDGSENTYPRLKIREGEHLFVSFSRFPDERAYEQFERRSSTELRKARFQHSALRQQLTALPETWALTPTPRSRVPWIGAEADDENTLRRL